MFTLPSRPETPAGRAILAYDARLPSTRRPATARVHRWAWICQGLVRVTREVRGVWWSFDPLIAIPVNAVAHWVLSLHRTISRLRRVTAFSDRNGWVDVGDCLSRVAR
jgi:hypothetical protein